jgi:hypothetical protein
LVFDDALMVAFGKVAKGLVLAMILILSEEE